MINRVRALTLFALTFATIGLAGVTVAGFKYDRNNIIEKTISDFRLKNVDGSSISLSDYPNAKGFIIIFTCNHCPFAKLYTKRLNKLSKMFDSLGVPLLAINSMDTAVYEDENFQKMQEIALAEKYNFPYLYDHMQTVVKDFKADHTPHAFIIWKENEVWKIKYSGAIDDNGQDPEIATPFISDAVEELLKGKKVVKSVTSSVGCRIFYRK